MAGAWSATAWSAGLRGLVFVISFIVLLFSFLGFNRKFAEWSHEGSDPHVKKMVEANARAAENVEATFAYYMSNTWWA